MSKVLEVALLTVTAGWLKGSWECQSEWELVDSETWNLYMPFLSLPWIIPSLY